jgi:hypothetical protein
LTTDLREIDHSYKPVVGLISGAMTYKIDEFDFFLPKPFSLNAYVEILQKYAPK